MQPKIKLGDEWWSLLSDREFSKEELEPFLKIPFVAVLEQGDQVRFSNVRPKRHVKIIMAQIAIHFDEHKKPDLQDGSIVFVPMG